MPFLAPLYPSPFRAPAPNARRAAPRPNPTRPAAAPRRVTLVDVYEAGREFAQPIAAEPPPRTLAPATGPAPVVVAPRVPLMSPAVPVEMLVYAGGLLADPRHPVPLLLDLATLVAGDTVAIRYAHGAAPDALVGRGTVTVCAGRLFVSGLLAETETARILRDLARAGTWFGASVGTLPAPIYPVPAGQLVEANGRRFRGPFKLLLGAHLDEVSVTMRPKDRESWTRFG